MWMLFRFGSSAKQAANKTRRTSKGRRTLSLEPLDRREVPATLTGTPMSDATEIASPTELFVAPVSNHVTIGVAAVSYVHHKFGDYVPGQTTAWRGVMIRPEGLNDAEIAELKSFRVNLIRWQLYAGNETVGTSTNYWNWFQQRLNDVANALPKLHQAGIRVVLDLHAPPGGTVGSGDATEHKLFKEGWAQNDFIRSWETIARRFAGNRTIVGYDLLNEPRMWKLSPGLRNWNTLSTDAIRTIRRFDADKAIVVEPRFGDPGRLNDLPRYSDPKIVYSAHVYQPHAYTHQGIQEAEGVQPRYPAGKAFTAEVRSQLTATIERIAAFQRDRGRPIYIGEFSASRHAPDEDQYVREAVRQFEQRGWEWSYHAYKEAAVWDFSVPDAAACRTVLLNAFARNAGPGAAASLAPSAVVASSPEIRVIHQGDRFTRSEVFDGQNGTVTIGSNTAGASAVATFMIRNEGKGPLRISRILVPRGFLMPQFPTVLNPGASFELRIATDGVVGYKSGRVEIHSNDVDEAIFDFSVKAKIFPRAESNPWWNGLTNPDPGGIVVDYGGAVRKVELAATWGTVPVGCRYVVSMEYMNGSTHRYYLPGTTRGLSFANIPSIVDNYTLLSVLKR